MSVKDIRNWDEADWNNISEDSIVIDLTGKDSRTLSSPVAVFDGVDGNSIDEKGTRIDPKKENEGAQVVAKIPKSEFEIHSEEDDHIYVRSGKLDEALSGISQKARKRPKRKPTFKDKIRACGAEVVGLTDNAVEEVGGLIEL